MLKQIACDTVFALCPTLSGAMLVTSTGHCALFSLNQMYFIISVSSVLCHCTYMFLNTEFSVSG